MSALYTGGVIFSLFVVLAFLERRFALRTTRHAFVRRWGINAVMSALAIGTGFLLVKPAATSATQAAESWRFGLLQWIELPPVVTLVAGVLLLDLSFYFWHMANHRLRVLWRFHVVHHIDPDLDVSTAFRFHPGEVALSTGFRVVQILLIGASPLTIAVYELMFHAGTLFHHSNVRLPIRMERLLNLVFVTPRMHGIHHSTVERENTSNFSVVFAWWDRLNRTLCLNIPQQRIVIGIPAHERAVDNAPAALMTLPFRRQRDAWRAPGGSRVTRDDSPLDTPQTYLAR